MPLPGGAADKLGNSYEGLWTVVCMADVMDERAVAIRLEPPGPEGTGIEFWLRTGGVLQYHQVKLRHSAGHWTVGQLGREGVLGNFWGRLEGTSSHCHFVSTHAADELKELADRVRRAASFEEYYQHFLNAHQHSTSFNQLRTFWPRHSQEVCYEALKRVYVRTIDEDTLRTMVETRIQTLVEGNPATTVDVLAQLALDRVHHELTAHEIWHHLASRDLHRRQWGQDPRVIAAINAANERFLVALRRETIQGKEIPRDEVGSTLNRLTSDQGKRAVLISGEAGVGKSNVLAQVVEALRSQGWPLLALRVDRLAPDTLTERVGHQLGLPGSPANVLAAVAQDRNCVLVIDQLDAVSFASGRQPAFFDCIHEIMRQAQAFPSMRLLLACRKFDIDNDHRLRNLTGDRGIADVIAVGHLDQRIVRKIVTELGLDAQRLTPRQLDLLRVPLHLSLLTQVADESRARSLSFETAKDLYDLFWDRKQDMIRERLNRRVDWTAVLDGLCDYMSEYQVLSAPEEIVDQYRDDALAMTSEHVLTRDERRYSFFHEGFFDYSFARRFAARGTELLPFVLGREQHLFRRAQVRQILVYEREASRDRYLSDLRGLLTNADIRFHLKKVVLGFLSQLRAPTVEEWEILAPLMLDHDSPLAAHVWRTLHGSVPWFQLLDFLGVLERWLRDSDVAQVDRCVTLLVGVQKSMPDRVAELVEPLVGTSSLWDDRLRYLVQWSDIGAGRRFFDLFLRLIDRGTLDEARGPIAANSDFWDLIQFLPRQKPEWACEVIGHYFNRRLELSLAAEQANPFEYDSERAPNRPRHDEDVFLEAARGAPLMFAVEVLPFMLKVMQANVQPGGPPRFDAVWRYRFSGGGHEASAALLGAIEAALSLLAANDPDSFGIIAKQLERLELETCQFLLIRGYRANGKRFADEAADYLLKVPERLETGYINSDYSATRQLLEAITPYCSEDKLVMLEETILGYYPKWEKSPKGRSSYGYMQFVLLNGIDPARRSPAVQRRLKELERKFGKQSILLPEILEAVPVLPPISTPAAEKMTESQWLKAIERYDRDSEHLGKDGELVGGVYELARVLEEQVRREPARFAKLVCTFPDQTHPAYFDAVLRGIAEAPLETGTAIAVLRKCHELPRRPCGKEICRMVGKLAKSSLSEEIIRIVAWYATNDEDPRQELWRISVSPDGKPYYGGDIYTAGINSVRGAAAIAVGQLIFDNASYVHPLRPTLERMVQDFSLSVRACVATSLLALLRHDRDLAVSLFAQLCDSEDELLESRSIERFLLYAVQTHFSALEAQLSRMMNSELPGVASAGARQACLAALNTEEAGPLLERCLSGSEAQRVGAAQVCAANLRTASYRELCEQALARLFSDADEQVRKEAATCFNHFDAAQLNEFAGLIEAFVQSQAFVDGYDSLIRALERTTSKLPGAALLAFNRFIETVGYEAGDIRTSASADAHIVSNLVIRFYAQTAGDPEQQARCLDLLDRMTQLGALGLDKALDLHDR